MEDATPLVMIAVLALIFWFLVLRPASRQRKQVAQLQASLKAGDKVMLTSGVFGELADLSEDRAQVRIAEGVVIEVARGAIGAVDPSGREPAEAESGVEAGEDTGA